MFNIFYGRNRNLNRAGDRPRRGRRNCNCYPKNPDGSPNLSVNPVQLNDCLMFVPCANCCANRVGANYTGVDAVGQIMTFK
jgi:hypothetical protein